MSTYTAEDLEGLPCACCGKAVGEGHAGGAAVITGRCCQAPVHLTYRDGAVRVECSRCLAYVATIVVARASIGSLSPIGDA